MKNPCQRWAVLFLFVAILGIQMHPAGVVAQDQAPPAAEASANDNSDTDTTPAEPLRPVNTEGIDAAGKKVGKGIEKLSAMAANYLGAWVNQETIAGIAWIKLLFCCLMLLGVMIVERLMRWGLQHKADAIPHRDGAISWLRLFLKAVIKPLSLFVYVYGIYAALSPLYHHFEAADGSNLILLVAKRGADIGGTVALFWFFFQLMVLLDTRLTHWADSTESSIDNILVPLIGKTLRVFIVIIGGMMVLQNLTGLKIGPLLASLGIGGLAIALAAKDSIANFFGTMTILFDKPFQVGDRIIINGYDGSVEHVGFRSTRIRLLNGHLVSIPNEKVVNSEVENVARRPNIRWLFQIDLPYDTPPDKVQEAVDILQKVLNDHEGMHPDLPPRVYFDGFKNWSLNITVVLWYHPPEWWDYQAMRQRTCLEIMRQFESAGIDFAFPSQTLYLANEEKRQLKLQMLNGETQNTNGRKP